MSRTTSDGTRGGERPRAYGDDAAPRPGRPRTRPLVIAVGAAVALALALLALAVLVVVDAGGWLVTALGVGMGVLGLVAGGTLGWALVSLRRERDQLARREADALRMAELDDLTGLGNYRMFMRQLAAEVARSRRYEDPFSLLLLDLDGFKEINDELGHLAGDDALRLVAVALRDTLREEDVCCRQGGDEFAVIAVRAGEDEARELGERLARAISEIPFGGNGERRLGASVGWATFGQPARSVDELIVRADAALRRTKRENGGSPRESRPPRPLSVAGRRRGRGASGSDRRAATMRLALLAGFARALSGVRDERAFADTTVAYLGGAFDTVEAAVVALDNDGDVRLASLSAGVLDERRREALATDPLARRALAAAGPAVVATDDEEPSWVGDERPRSALAVAIRDETRTWGWLAVASDRPRAYDLAERALAEAIAQQLGRAVTCRRLLNRVRDAGFGELYRVAIGSAAAAGSESWRIAELAWQAGRALGLEDRELRALYLAALFHDVGTVGVPSVLLSHPGELREEEREILREHALVGERMLRSLPLLREAAPIVRHGHERFDGGGYPDNLAGEDIPLPSRILLACDTFVSITSPRPWRPARSVDAAQAELRRVAGTQLDPRVVDAVLGVLGAPRSAQPAPPPVGAAPAAPAPSMPSA